MTDIRNLQIIGEAARHVPATVRARWPQVPWAQIRGMRNIVIHEYFGVSLDIVWQTTQRNLPPLKTVLCEILEREP